MAKYLEEKLQYRIEKDQGKAEVANKLMKELSLGPDSHPNGAGDGAGYSVQSNMRVRFEPLGGGRTTYHTIERYTDRQGV